ncbi:MAG: tRNA (guanosine(46)-N7)-methyltransferase TrmB [Woeseia sp.]|nr:tRNA (guanosine(46)-N7)-methyltransferase TrmB [Woeseia sp.]
MISFGRTPRTVRSFVRRTGRMTGSQQRAIRDLLSTYGVGPKEEPLDFDNIFGRQADRVLDIGFGNGEALVCAAQQHPEQDFLGVEVHEPGVGHCLLIASKAGISNLRIVIQDAVEVLRERISDESITRMNLLFPDPWPKKRHHKRRLLRTPFVDLVGEKLRPGGSLHIATDWANYAEQIDAVMSESDVFELEERTEHCGDRPIDRQTTKFESRGIAKGHQIWDWKFIRSP